MRRRQSGCPLDYTEQPFTQLPRTVLAVPIERRRQRRIVTVGLGRLFLSELRGRVTASVHSLQEAVGSAQAPGSPVSQLDRQGRAPVLRRPDVAALRTRAPLHQGHRRNAGRPQDRQASGLLIEDMPDPPRRLPGDPALYKAIADMWAFGRRTNPRRFPPGVYKYRSIQEMDRAQEQLLAEHIAALQRQRHGDA